MFRIESLSVGSLCFTVDVNVGRNMRPRVVANRNKSNSNNGSRGRRPSPGDNCVGKTPSELPTVLPDFAKGDKCAAGSDERVWRFRPPPRGLTANEYTLCDRYVIRCYSTPTEAEGLGNFIVCWTAEAARPQRRWLLRHLKLSGPCLVANQDCTAQKCSES